MCPQISYEATPCINMKIYIFDCQEVLGAIRREWILPFLSDQVWLVGWWSPNPVISSPPDSACKDPSVVLCEVETTFLSEGCGGARSCLEKHVINQTAVRVLILSSGFSPTWTVSPGSPFFGFCVARHDLSCSCQDLRFAVPGATERSPKLKVGAAAHTWYHRWGFR